MAAERVVSWLGLSAFLYSHDTSAQLHFFSVFPFFLRCYFFGSMIELASVSFCAHAKLSYRIATHSHDTSAQLHFCFFLFSVFPFSYVVIFVGSVHAVD